MKGRSGLRRRSWVEAGLGLASLTFAVLTLRWRDWVEMVFRVDPDHHRGGVEVALVSVCLAVSLITLLAVRLEWRSTGVRDLPPGPTGSPAQAG